MTKKLSIFLIDDKQMVREGIRLVIEREPDMAVIGEAGTEEVAIRQIDRLKPQIAIFDLHTYGIDSREMFERMHMLSPGTKLLTVSATDDCGAVRTALECGAAGFIRKRSTAPDLIAAIREVARGNLYLDANMTDAVLAPFVKRRFKTSLPVKTELSARESEVLRMIAQGYSNKEIATRLSISAKSVETYKTRSMEKVGLENRVDIVRYALKSGWLQGN